MAQAVQRFDHGLFKSRWLIALLSAMNVAFVLVPPVLFWVLVEATGRFSWVGLLWVLALSPMLLALRLKVHYVVEIDEARETVVLGLTDLLLRYTMRSIPFADIDRAEMVALGPQLDADQPLPRPALRLRNGETVWLALQGEEAILKRFNERRIVQRQAIVDAVSAALARSRAVHSGGADGARSRRRPL